MNQTGNGALAIGTHHLNSGDRSGRVLQLLQSRLHPLQGEIHAPEIKARQQVTEVLRMGC